MLSLVGLVVISWPSGSGVLFTFREQRHPRCDVACWHGFPITVSGVRCGAISVKMTLLNGLAAVDQETGKIFEFVLGGQRLRVVFAALVLAAESPVSRRDLALAIWGEDLPTA